MINQSITKKKMFLQTFGWPLFRDCDTFRGHHVGIPGPGGRAPGGVGTWKLE